MLKNNWAIIDVEGDGLNPTKLYVLAYQTKDKAGHFTDYDDMRKFLLSLEYIIFHNGIRWDFVHLQRLLGIQIKAKLIDTLAISWYLEPLRIRHGIESYGKDFNIEKPFVENWFEQALETYIHRCVEDVKINTVLWNNQWKKLMELYGDEKQALRLISYLEFKMNCARIQEQIGWKLDTKLCGQTLQELTLERDSKVEQLAQAMPVVPLKSKRLRPKKFFNALNGLTKKAQEYLDLIRWHDPVTDVNELPEETEVVIGYEEGNPKSHVQIKDWLFSLGWEPQTFKYVKDKTTREVRAIPQIANDLTKDICPSIVKLYDKEPRLELLDGLSVLSHRISILEGFINSVDDNGYVRARIQGLTNTLRFQHAEIVNLPRVNRPYAENIRGSLICEADEVLIGADMSSLEDRLKQHFIYPLDPEYVKSMLSEDYDPHLNLAVAAGMMSQEDADAYKKGDKSKKAIRDTAKNGTYACQYGAYPKRLSITCGISMEEAQELFDGYWKVNWAIKKVAESQITKETDDGQKWLFNPISNLWYSLRTDNDRFSTLVQGSASFCFDTWIGFIQNRWPHGPIGQFHDEGVWVAKLHEKEDLERIVQEAINKTNQRLKLNRELDIGIQTGKNYGEIH